MSTEVLVFGMAPEVEAVGDDGVVLGFEDWADDVDDDSNFALAEVLAFGGLTVVEGAGGGVRVLVKVFGTGALIWRAGCGCG
jgi:hypothetical protein